MESVTAFGVLLMMVMAIEEVATANRHFQVKKDGARYLEETLLLWFHFGHVHQQKSKRLMLL